MSRYEQFDPNKALNHKTFIAEGLSEYEEEKEEVKRAAAIEHAQEVQRNATQFLDSFYAADNEKRSELEETLSTMPIDVRQTILKEWFVRDPDTCFVRLEKIGTAPESFQKELTKYLLGKLDQSSTHSHDFRRSAVFGILTAFQKITYRPLHKWLMDYVSEIDISIFFSFREKLPYAEDEDLLKYVRDRQGNLNWSLVVPHLDQFSTLKKMDRSEIVKTLLNEKSSRYDLGFVVEFRDKLGLSAGEVIDLFVSQNRVSDLLYKINTLPPEFHQKIVDVAVRRGNAQTVLFFAERIQDISIPAVIRLIASLPKNNDQKNSFDGVDTLLHSLSTNASIWGNQYPADVVDLLIDRSPERVLENMRYFQGNLDQKRLIQVFSDRGELKNLITLARDYGSGGFVDGVDVVNLIIDKEGGAELFWQRDTCPQRLSRRVYLRLLEKDPIKTKNIIDHFTGLTREDVVGAVPVIMPGYTLDTLIHYKTPEDQWVLDTEMAILFIEHGHAYSFVRSLHQHKDKFENIDYPRLARKLIDVGEVSLLAGWFDYFPGVEKDRSLGGDLFSRCLELEDWDASAVVNIFLKYEPPLNRIFAKAYDIFGDQITQKTYTTVEKIFQGELDADEVRLFGISRSGEEGLRQMKESVDRFRESIFTDSFDARLLLISPFHLSYYRRYVRHGIAQWGKQGEVEFKETTKYFLDAKEQGRIAPLPPEYTPSGNLHVDKIDREAVTSFKYSEQFLSRYQTMKESLAQSFSLLQESKPFSLLVGRLGGERQAVLAKMEEKLAQLVEPRAKDNLQGRIETLRKIQLRSVKDFQTNFSTLAKFSEFHDLLRQIVFFYALHKHKELRDDIDNLTKRTTPAFEDIGMMVNFIDHIVNEETWKQYFTDKNAAKEFRGLTNIKALEEEFARAQQQATKGTTNMEFIPSRGLPMEFSGQIADACWANKYTNIGSKFPNFTSVILTQNRGTKHERLAGASMLIETVAADGTPLLVIRGLNPIENVINNLSVEDFFQKYTAYCRSIAEKRGRKLAIVIDDHSGGSSTNRPVLFNFLSRLQPQLTRAPLQSTGDTMFNGYDISNDTYYV